MINLGPPTLESLERKQVDIKFNIFRLKKVLGWVVKHPVQLP